MIDRAPNDRATDAWKEQAIANDHVHAIRRITSVVTEPEVTTIHS